MRLHRYLVSDGIIYRCGFETSIAEEKSTRPLLELMLRRSIPVRGGKLKEGPDRKGLSYAMKRRKGVRAVWKEQHECSVWNASLWIALNDTAGPVVWDNTPSTDNNGNALRIGNASLVTFVQECRLRIRRPHDPVRLNAPESSCDTESPRDRTVNPYVLMRVARKSSAVRVLIRRNSLMVSSETCLQLGRARRVSNEK